MMGQTPSKIRQAQDIGRRQSSSFKKGWFPLLFLGTFFTLAGVWPEGRLQSSQNVYGLAEALSRYRGIEPRLTGGFPHVPCDPVEDSGRAIPLSRCSPEQVTDDARRATTLQILQIAPGESAADRLHLLGIIQVVGHEDAQSMDEAVRYLERAARQMPDDAYVRNDLAVAYFLRAQREDAPYDLVRALSTIERAIELDPSLPEALFNRALFAEHLFLSSVAKLAWEHYLGFSHEEAWAAEARRHLNQLPSSEEAMEQERKWNPALPGQISLSLGTALFRHGDLVGSLKHFEAAALSLREAGDVFNLGIVHSRMAESQEALGQRESSWRYRYLALKSLKQFPEASELLQSLRDAAATIDSEEARGALVFQREAILLGERAGSRPQADPNAAGAASDLDLIQAQLELARARIAAGLHADAEKDLWQAIDLFEGRREYLDQPALRQSYSETAQRLYEEMILFQVDKRRRPLVGLEIAERARLWKDPRGRGYSFSTAEFHRLPKSVGIVEYALIGDELLTWVVSRGRIELIRQAVEMEDLRYLVNDWVGTLEKGGAIWNAPESLYRILIPDAVREEGLNRLYFVPDKFLGGVPFAALREAASGRFLIEDFAVSVFPSARDCVHSLAQDPEEKWRPEVLLVGNPAFDRKVFFGVPPLAGADREVDSIEQLYQGSQIVRGTAATREKILSAMDNFDVFHFAGHSMSNARYPHLSFLMLAPGYQDSGALFAHEVETLKFRRLRLVVLSACDTISSLNSRVSSVSGMSKAFLDSGVGAVLGSLWKVNDNQAEDFMRRFHERLVKTGSASRALRETQLEWLRGGDSTLSSPTVWGNFQLIGALEQPPTPAAPPPSTE